MANKTDGKPLKLRSQAWFDNPNNIDMTALYLERMMNFGLSLEELQSGKPIIGIAQSGSDITPCNRHHLELAKRTREGSREAGGAESEVETRLRRLADCRAPAGDARHVGCCGHPRRLRYRGWNCRHPVARPDQPQPSS